jgi:hypothetical protein
MAKTRQITVNSVTPTPVTVTSLIMVGMVRLMENRGVANWPTTDLLILKPSNVDVPVRIPAGSSYILRGIRSLFLTGQTLCYIQTVTGSTTIDVDEDGQ